MNTYPSGQSSADQTIPSFTQYMAQPGGCPTCGAAQFTYPAGQASDTGTADTVPAQVLQGQMPAVTQPAGRTAATGDFAPILPSTQPMPVTTQTVLYLNGYLRTQIGKKVTVTFLIGTGTQVDRTGTLLAVGANYIVINEIETDDIVICDFYTIKFIRVYY